MMGAPHHPVYFWDPPLDLDCSCMGESISLLSSFCKSSAFTSVHFLRNPYYQGDVNHGSLQHCQGSLGTQRKPAIASAYIPSPTQVLDSPRNERNFEGMSLQEESEHMLETLKQRSNVGLQKQSLRKQRLQQ
jgi:hypothetical protein